MVLKVAVMSNKGGVGKTTVSIALAYALREEGARVALVDIDFHGPTLPILMGADGAKPKITADGITPVTVDGIQVMSLHYLLRHDDDPVLWSGDIKRNIVKELVGGRSVLWDDYDVMVVDSPPSLGDENMTLISMIDGIILVTTPHPASIYDIRKMLRVVKLANKKLYALVLNMEDMFEGKLPEVEAPVVKIPFDKEIQRNPRAGSKYLRDIARMIVEEARGA